MIQRKGRRPRGKIARVSRPQGPLAPERPAPGEQPKTSEQRSPKPAAPAPDAYTDERAARVASIGERRMRKTKRDREIKKS